MHVQGDSPWKVAAITKELCGLDVSSAQVSRAAKLLDEELDAWRSRKLDQVQYLVLDARYEKVRVDGTVRDWAVSELSEESALSMSKLQEIEDALLAKQ
jgi:transposase-like protein